MNVVAAVIRDVYVCARSDKQQRRVRITLGINDG